MHYEMVCYRYISVPLVYQQAFNLRTFPTLAIRLQKTNSAEIDLYQVNNGNTKTMCEICLKLTRYYNDVVDWKVTAGWKVTDKIRPDLSYY